MQVPFFSFECMHASIRDEIQKAFLEFYDSNWYILGERVERFEKQYASFNEVAHCVGVSNGLDALHLCLRSLNIGNGDEVIVPSNTYIASVLAISYVGATPVFVEPDPGTFNIDPALIEAAITQRTKAIMPVHLYGQCCEMDPIMNIASGHELFVVEDNAQAHGARFNGRMTGSFGHANATSFYPTKNFGALGDGGAVTTGDELLAKKIRTLRNYGSEKKYVNEVIGYNMRLDEAQATFLALKLPHLAKWTDQRRQIAKWYDESLRNIGDLSLPAVAPGSTHVYHLYVIKTQYRNALQEFLTKQGVGTLIHYPVPPHLQKAYRHLGFKKNDFPIAEEIANTCISIPLWPGMQEQQVEYVTNSIANFFKSIPA